MPLEYRLFIFWLGVVASHCQEVDSSVILLAVFLLFSPLCANVSTHVHAQLELLLRFDPLNDSLGGGNMLLR